MQGFRGVLSCTSCRQRKLRCDREEPCSNCRTRNISCVYTTVSRSRNLAHQKNGNQQLYARIHQLEHLISTSIGPGQQGQTATYDPNIQEPEAVAENQGPNSSGTPYSTDIEVKPGRMISNNGQMVYVSGIHWAAICNEVANIKEHLNRDYSGDPSEFPGQTQYSGPMLLEGTSPISDLEGVLSDIPPKDVADRLVSRYFNSNDPSTVLIHAPTFEQEYRHFWHDPHDFSAPWLSLLFGIMCMGTFLYMRSQEDIPGGLGSPLSTMDTFQRCSTECLIMSKYSTFPTSYTMEALLLNIQSEFVRRRDAHLGVWILSGIAIRLAMRMGYHRDPEHYPQILTFPGEMRRRVWAAILQLDAMTSSQIGLPSMIQETQCDTQLPRNLLDEDFDADTVQLPLPRPHTELTPVSYTVAKSRILSVFRTIFNDVCLGRTDAYNEIMALDQRLLAVHSSIPPRLRMTMSGASVTIPPYLLIQRYNIELLFQKARCFLHRHHMAKAYQDPTFNYSRSSCIDAAMAMLSHQTNILKEVQVGGLLYRDKWFVSSLEQHDFLLASMIVCLELSPRSSTDNISPSSNNYKFGDCSRDEMVEALKSSRRFWEEFKASSTEAQSGLDLISAMLEKVCTTSDPRQSLLGNDQTPDFPSEAFCSHENSTSRATPFHSLQPPAGLSGHNSPLEGIESMLASPSIVDWDMWEAFLQNSRTAPDSQGL